MEKKAEKKSHMTKERLLGRFKSQFDLVNYAIKLAENMIRSQRDTRYKTPVQNRAYQILGEIALGLDKFEDLANREEARRREEERHFIAASRAAETAAYDEANSAR